MCLAVLFAPAPVAPTTLDYFPDLAVVGDLNGDGVPDLAVANYNPGVGATVSVLPGTGRGGFVEAPSPPIFVGLVASVAAGDFTGNGRRLIWPTRIRDRQYHVERQG